MDSLSGKRYFITFKDDKTRKTSIYFLNNKHEALAKFIEFKVSTGNEINKKVRFLRLDNRIGFVNKPLTDFYVENGIQHQKSTGYCSQQNGVSGE